MARHMRQFTEKQRARMRAHKKSKPSTLKRLERREAARKEILEEGDKAAKNIEVIEEELKNASLPPDDRAAKKDKIAFFQAMLKKAKALQDKLDSYKAPKAA